MIKRTLFLSAASLILVCHPVVAQMSSSVGNYSNNSSGGSFSNNNSGSYFGGGYSSNSGSPMGGTASTSWENPSSYQYRPAKKSSNGQFKFIAKSAIGYTVYSKGKTLYVQGLNQAIVDKYQIKLGDFVQRLLAKYPGYQSVRLM